MPRKSTGPSKPKRTRASAKRPPAPAGEVELLPAPVADAVIDELVDALNELQRESGFSFARKVGNLVLDAFYRGDLGAWRDRGPKDSSFRKLAARADGGDLQMSAAGLYRCVALVELEERLGVSDWKQLTVSHVRAVFGLPEHEQKKLIIQAEDKGWTVERIEQAARAVRDKNADGRGRPPLPAFVKTVNKLGKFLEAGDEAFGEMDKVEHLDASEAKRLHEAVTGMKLKCEELQQALARRVPGLA